MKTQLLLSLALVACLGPQLGGASNLVPLNFDDYYAAWKRNDVTVVEFHSPTSAKSKVIAPRLEELADHFKGRAVVASVDATDDLEFAQEYRVRNYPEFKLFKKGLKQPANYAGLQEMKTEDLIAWVDQWVGPSPKVLTTASEVEEHMATLRSVVGFFKGKPSKEFQKMATEQRNHLRYAVVDLSQSPDLAELAGGAPSVRIANRLSIPIAELPRYTSADGDLQTWLTSNCYPPVVVSGQQINCPAPVQKEMRDPLVYAFIDMDNSTQLEEVSNVLLPVAVANSKRVGTIIESRSSGQADAIPWPDPDSEEPLIAIVDPKDKFYNFDGPLESAALGDFVKAYFARKLKPLIKSESMSIASTTDGLTTIVGETFSPMIMRNRKQDILLEFYSPECGHCQALAPKYEALAKGFEGVETLLVAKMNGIDNDWDHMFFQVQGYPSIFFIPARPGKKDKLKPIKYDDDRTVDALAAFVRQHAVHPLPADLTFPEPKMEEDMAGDDVEDAEEGDPEEGEDKAWETTDEL